MKEAMWKRVSVIVGSIMVPVLLLGLVGVLVVSTSEVVGGDNPKTVPTTRTVAYWNDTFGRLDNVVEVYQYRYGTVPPTHYTTRSILEFPWQGQAQNITEVILRLRVEQEQYAVGQIIYAARVTRQPTLTETDWHYWKSGSAWTSGGGDFTSQDIAWTYGVAGGSYMYWDVTEMAKTEWENDRNLFIIIYGPAASEENPTYSIDWYRYTNGPQLTVTWAEAPVEPELVGTLEWATDAEAEIKLSVSLMGLDDLDVRVEYHEDGEAEWGSVTVWENVTVDGSVYHNLPGLAKETKYHYRVAGTDGETTWYSDEKWFWTDSITWPEVGTPSITAKSITTADIDVEFDRGEGGNGVGWVETRWPGRQWRASNSHVIAIDDIFSFELDAEHLMYQRVGDEAQLRGVFSSGGSVVYGPTVTLTLDKVPVVSHSVSHVTPSSFKVNWMLLYMQGGYNVIVELAHKGPGIPVTIVPIGTFFTDANDVIEVTGLSDLTEYQFRFELTFEGYKHYQYWYPVWVTGIENVPEVITVSAVFIEPNIIEFKAGLTLNDAAGVPHYLYFEFYEPGSGLIHTTTFLEDVVDGGNVIQHTIGGVLKWDTQYRYRARFNYTIGTVSGELLDLTVPEWRTVVITLSPSNVTETSALLRGEVRLGPASSVNILWRVQCYETGEQVFAKMIDEPVTVDGVETYQVSGLETGKTYRYRIESYGDFWGTGGWVVFTATKEGWIPDLPGGAKGLEALKVMIGLIVTVGAGGVIMFKLRQRSGTMIAGVAVIGCIALFALVGWFPLWIVLLLALGLAAGVVWLLKGGVGNEA